MTHALALEEDHVPAKLLVERVLVEDLLRDGLSNGVAVLDGFDDLGLELGIDVGELEEDTLVHGRSIGQNI